MARAGGWQVDVTDLGAGSGRGGVLRWTLLSAIAWGSAFLAASVAGALIAGVSPLRHLGPVGALTVIGATVGGLVGPLARGLARRRR